MRIMCRFLVSLRDPLHGLGALYGGINAKWGHALLITRYNARSVRSWLAQRVTEGTVQTRWAKLDVLNIEIC